MLRDVEYVKNRVTGETDEGRVIFIKDANSEWTDTEKGVINTVHGDTFAVIQLEVDEILDGAVEGWFVNDPLVPTSIQNTPPE